ncbi:MAG: sensor histidine kinase [Polyangiaceae bacterium]
MDELRSGQNRHPPDTLHAPAERATDKQLRKLVTRALENPILQAVFEAIGGCGLVIDRHRQIIAANDTALSLLGAHLGRSLDGLRFGEALQCVNACRGPSGCGTSIQCRHCGAVALMLLAQITEHPVDGSCTVTFGEDRDLRVKDLKLRITPLFLGGERVYFFVFQDVTAVKWHELQEHVFLHDLANLVMGLEGWVDELNEGTTEDTTHQILQMVHRLAESVETHRALIRAEGAEVQVVPESISFERLGEELRSQFAASICAKDHRLVIDTLAATATLETDRRLLVRVLANLLKNAFEASPARGEVTLTIRSEKDTTVFDVHNRGTMAKEVAEQLFRRRFSTKGNGRGLGIYSVQIFGEHYLGGQVTFTSSDPEGTMFHLRLPNHSPRIQRDA